MWNPWTSRHHVSKQWAHILLLFVLQHIFVCAHRSRGRPWHWKSSSMSKGQGKSEGRCGPQFIKVNLPTRRVWAAARQMNSHTAWQAPKNYIKSMGGGRRGTVTDTVMWLLLGTGDYMLDQVRTRSCSRNQHVMGGRRGVGILVHVRRNIN